MNCPACHHINTDKGRFCSRCRLRFTSLSVRFTRGWSHLIWIFRRANAGLLTGLVAWFFIPALSRSFASNMSLFFPQGNLENSSLGVIHFILTGLLGGAFLGSVDGLVEDSSQKLFRGIKVGGVGGLIGGLVFALTQSHFDGGKIWMAFFLEWGIIGGAVGMVSAGWERQKKKMVVAVLCGVLGGGMGGALGSTLYITLLGEIRPESWWVIRLCESASGGLTGLSLWFFVGLAERLVVFKRRPLSDPQHKKCDQCGQKNELRAWYCTACGSVLQESAPPEKLHLPRFSILERLSGLLSFLGRLSVTSGFLGGVIIFLAFLFVNPFLAFVLLILSCMIGYTMFIFFLSLSETLDVFVSKA